MTHVIAAVGGFTVAGLVYMSIPYVIGERIVYTVPWLFLGLMVGYLGTLASSKVR